MRHATTSDPGPAAAVELEATLERTISDAAALTAEVERLTLRARELARNPDAWKPSARAAQVAASLHGLQAREADLERACLALQCALVRWERGR
jgi:hypothetical protein